MNEDELAEIAERGYEGMVVLTTAERNALLTLAASAIEDFRRRAIEAVRNGKIIYVENGQVFSLNQIERNACADLLQSLPATENNTNE